MKIMDKVAANHVTSQARRPAGSSNSTLVTLSILIIAGTGISGDLNCDRPSAGTFNLLDDRRGRVYTFRVGDGLLFRYSSNLVLCRSSLVCRARS